MKMMARQHAFQRGFTFLELSFVMIVLGTAAALLAQAVPAMRRSASTADTVRNVTNVEFSLLSYVAIHGRLPCADTDDDGVENAAPACASIGKLPYVTLGYTGPLVNGDGYDFKYGLYRAAGGPALRDTALLSKNMERYRPSVGSGYPVTLGDPSVAVTTSNHRLDFCQGLRSAMNLPFDGQYLHVEEHGRRRHVAYVLVDPGVGNMDLQGDRFDGLNGSATAAVPKFEHPNRPQSMLYDDRVTVSYFDQMWESLGCSANMATAGRAQPNIETMLALFEQAAVDYHTQLDIAVDIAFAENFVAGSAIAAASVGLASSVASMFTDIASSINTVGATAPSAVAAGLSIGLNTAAVAVAIANQVFTVLNYNDMKDYRSKFETLVSTKLNPLYDSVKNDVARSTSLVFSDQ